MKIKIEDLKKNKQGLPFGSHEHTMATLAIVDYYIEQNDIKALKEYSSNLPFGSEVHEKATSAIVDYFIKHNDMKALKEYSYRSLPFGSQVHEKATSAIVDYFIEHNDMKALKEYSYRSLPFGSQVYEKATSAIVDYSDSEICIKAKKAIANSVNYKLNYFSDSGVLFFSKSNGMTVEGKHLMDEGMAYSAFGQSSNIAKNFLVGEVLPKTELPLSLI